jgi:hypothetical protein
MLSERIRASSLVTALGHAGYLFSREQDQHQRRRDFSRIVKGRNFMTPALVGFFRLKAKPYVIVEVSMGEFVGDDLIGVTVVDCAQRVNEHDLSRCVHSADELVDAMRKLEEHYH